MTTLEDSQRNDGVAARTSPSFTLSAVRRMSRDLTLYAALADLGVILIATVLAAVQRESLPYLRSVGDLSDKIFPVAVLIAAVWIFMLIASGAYRTRQFGTGTGEYTRVLQASLLAMALVGVAAYLTGYHLSRGFYLILLVFGPALLVVERYLLRHTLHWLRGRGKLMTPTLLAGSPEHISDLMRVLERERWLGYNVVGMLGNSAEVASGDLPYLGPPSQARLAIRRTNARAVIFTEGSFNRALDFNRMARDLELEDAETIVVPALTNISAERMALRPVAGIPLVHVERPQAAAAGRWLKRAFDIVGSSLLIILASPVMLVTALAVKFGDGGPIFFRQTRVGFRGNTFSMLKFRSMVPNAEELKKQLMAQNEGAGVLFKMANDPRITKVGRFIRRYSIDELPQFFNVLNGDMSLVGPRPALPKEVDAYDPHVRRRLDVRPGLTGLWQVSGRSSLSWEDTVRLDLYYVDNWSIMQDLTILTRTFRAVVGRSGAY